MPTKKIFYPLLFLSIFLFSGCVPMLPGGSQKEEIITGKGIHRSMDRGISWEEKNTIINLENSLTVSDIRQMSFSRFDADTIYMTTMGGFYVSMNNGESWKQIIGKKFIYDFFENPKTPGVLYAISGNQMYLSRNNGENWDTIYTDTRKNSRLIGLSVSGKNSSVIYVATSLGQILKSDDWGLTWMVHHDFRANIRKYVTDPHNPDHMYVLGYKGVWQSLDGGESWNEVLFYLMKNEEGIDYSGLNKYIRLIFTSKEGTIFYLSNYGIMKTTDNAKTWEPLNLLSPPNSVTINSMTYNPNNLNELYYTIGNVLYQTFNGGKSWKTIKLPIPGGTYVQYMAMSPHDANAIFIGVKQ